VVQPFGLETAKRGGRKPEKGPPLLLVELMIAPGKVANIAIHKDDKAEDLAKKFSMTYSLNRKAQDALADLLNKHIEEEGGSNERKGLLEVLEEEEAEWEENLKEKCPTKI